MERNRLTDNRKNHPIEHKTIKERLGNRNVGIDMLRGLCILSVLLLHLNIHFSFTQSFLKEALPKKLFSLLFWSGFYGVVIFFTLSGYLIARSILKRWGALSQVHLKTFFWYRFSRIIPLLTALLLILSVLHVSGVQGFVIDPEKTSLTRALFAAFTFHINWLQTQVGYLPGNWDVLWSISIEESFYLVFPFVCLFLRRDWHFVVLLLLFLAVSPWARTHWFVGNELGDRNHLAFVDSIALGVMTAVVTFRIGLSRWWARSALLLGIVLMSLVLVFRGFLFKSGLVGLGLNVTLLSLGVSLLLLWMHHNKNAASTTTPHYWKWLRNMGVYSYEIYLTHMFVVLLGARWYKSLELGTDWLLPYCLLVILIAYFLGALVFNYFSEPVNLWLRSRWKANVKKTDGDFS